MFIYYYLHKNNGFLKRFFEDFQRLREERKEQIISQITIKISRNIFSCVIVTLYGGRI